MKLVMIAPVRNECGVSDYSAQLTDALRENPDLTSVETVAFPNLGAMTTLDALRNYVRLRQKFIELARNVDAKNADVAHVQHQYFFFGGVSPLKNHARAFFSHLKTPVVLTVHERIAWEVVPGFKGRLLHRVNRANFLAPNIKAWIVHTQEDRNGLIHDDNNKGRVQRGVTEIPHAVLPAPPFIPKDSAKELLGLEGKTVLTILGFISAKKGYEDALNALKLLPENVVLLIAGGKHPDDASDSVARLLQRIEALELTERVKITGYLPAETLVTVLRATDLALAPFVQSSGSGSLSLWFSAGVPVIASAIAPHKELLDKTPGLLALVWTNIAASFAFMIERLLSEPETCLAMQETALRYAESQSWANVAARHVEVYRRAL